MWIVTKGWIRQSKAIRLFDRMIRPFDGAIRPYPLGGELVCHSHSLIFLKNNEERQILSTLKRNELKVHAGVLYKITDQCLE